MTLQKTEVPVLSPESLPPIDALLLSHNEHADNLDERARAWLPNAARILTTTAAAERLGVKANGLRPWESTTVEGDGISLRVTGMPAQHAPDGTEHISGLVPGFLLEWDGAPGGVYISGDTIPHAGLREISRRYRGKVALAFLHPGHAKLPIFPGAAVSMSAAEAASLANDLQVQRIVPIHYEGWTHFSEDRAAAERAFESAGWSDRVLWLEPGRPTDLFG